MPFEWSQRSGKYTGRTGDQRKNRDQPDHSTPKIAVLCKGSIIERNHLKHAGILERFL